MQLFSLVLFGGDIMFFALDIKTTLDTHVIIYKTKQESL